MSIDGEETKNKDSALRYSRVARSGERGGPTKKRNEQPETKEKSQGCGALEAK